VGEAPFVDQLAQEFKDKGLIVLAVMSASPRRRLKKYLEEHPRSCPIVLMEDTNRGRDVCRRRSYTDLCAMIEIAMGTLRGHKTRGGGRNGIAAIPQARGIGSDSDTEN